MTDKKEAVKDGGFPLIFLPLLEGLLLFVGKGFCLRCVPAVRIVG
jgi:hypothetical protein